MRLDKLERTAKCRDSSIVVRPTHTPRRDQETRSTSHKDTVRANEFAFFVAPLSLGMGSVFACLQET